MASVRIRVETIWWHGVAQSAIPKLQVRWFFLVKILNLCHVIISQPMDIARGWYTFWQDGGATPDYAIGCYWL